VLLLYDTWGDIDVIVESITTLTVLLAASTKLINIVMNNHKVSCQIVNVISCEIFYFFELFFLLLISSDGYCNLWTNIGRFLIPNLNVISWDITLVSAKK